MHRPPVDLPVGAEVVAEDAVGAHRRHPQLVVDDAQGLGELLADRPAAGAVGAQHVAEVLGADHRPPGPVQRPGRPGGVDADGHRGRPRRLRRRRHRRRQRPDGVGVGHGRDRVPAGPAASTWVSAYGRVRHGQHRVAAVVVEGLERPLGGVGAVHEVADRAGHRRPVQGDLGPAGAGGQPGRSGQGGRAGGEVALPRPGPGEPERGGGVRAVSVLLAWFVHLMPVVATLCTK